MESNNPITEVKKASNLKLSNSRFAAMQQESKARQEETTKRFDDVMKASAALTSKIQPENEKKNTGPQYHDLGFLMNTRNLNGSLDPKKKRVEGVVFQDKNNEFEVGSGSNGIGNRRGSFGAHFRFRKLNMPIFEGEDAHGWIYRMERYFDIQEIQEIDQLWAAILCMGRVRPYHVIVGVRERLRLGLGKDWRVNLLEFRNRFWRAHFLCDATRRASPCHEAENKTCNNVLRGDHRCPSQTLQVLLVDESDGSDAEAAPELEVNDGMQEQRSIKRKF
ncbi:hypothetical protein Tco_1287600 [Tanacetum coccineum]